MKFYKTICSFIMIGLCYACDTRDDYFYDHTNPPTISLVAEKDSTIDGKKYICIDVTWGDSIEINYRFDDIRDYIGDFTAVVKPRTKNRDDYYYWKDLAIVDYLEDGTTDSWYYPGDSPYDYTQFDNHLCVKIDTARNKILIIESTSSAKEYYFNNGRSNIGKLGKDSLTIDAVVTLSTANILGLYGSANILLKLYVNRPPIVNFTLASVTGYPLHRKIETHCTDPDNDKIILYEYCIDGKVFDHTSGYDWGSDKVYEKGKGAYNGTYITGTQLSSVKHAFQEAGDHTISVRCQDQWGNWSTWCTETIYIE